MLVLFLAASAKVISCLPSHNREAPPPIKQSVSLLVIKQRRGGRIRLLPHQRPPRFTAGTFTLVPVTAFSLAKKPVSVFDSVIFLLRQSARQR